MSEAARDTPGLVLRPREGRPFRFDPGTLCLELLPTGGIGPYAVYEVLREPADLVRWAGESRLPAGLALTVSAAELVLARHLRSALWRLTQDHAEGRGPGPDDLDVVNAVAAAPPLVARIDAEGRRAWAPEATGTALLSTVARDAVDLLTGPFAERIRVCEAHDCALLFVDTSRPGRRRWCAMERCGNRHKVRAHRARHTESAEEGT
ncbi:CGNR zinc finger domain-containing protein [Streptomyces sp. NPDC058620]|uniref:CGNR zinc finger domain-containing protein n=1 Tax=Streptomyces sp. NPDC058620 TaxID=3346560 RepID=UPI00366074F0